MSATYNKQCPWAHLLHDVVDGFLLLIVGDAHKTGQVYDIEAKHIALVAQDVENVKIYLIATVPELDA